ncbi:WXG100 family type VII secretion target [Streptomyces uncialis]|uniref:WXG100 family type VII secretion target n=1 Tax=Streptomyces uncialis TaxID=1048205 RepID=UPI003403626B
MTDDGESTPDTADLERVAQQVGATDMVVKVSDLLENTFFFNAPSISPGRTSFESHRLNDMIDLVQNTNPAELEEAGNALWNARDAIKKAAEALKGHIGQPDWEGEAGEAFRRWGQALVSDALQLSDFADVAGTQITAVGTGLASVRSSMPPRDARADPKAAEDFPPDKRNSDNEDYTAALKAEKHRQEAINQMNRLASFYAVSEQVLSTQEGPTFAPMPKVGVPRPTSGKVTNPSANAANGPVTQTSQTGTPGYVENGSGRVADAAGSGVGLEGTSTPVVQPGRTVPEFEAPTVGTEIASVGTVPASAPPTSVVGAPPGGTPPVGGTAPMPPATGGPPVVAAIPRSAGGGTARSLGQAQATSRPGQARAGGTESSGRVPAGASGRAPLLGQGATRQGIPGGTASGQGATRQGMSGGTASGQAPVGRAISGGSPRGGQAMPRTGGGPMPPVGNSGIVGGRPVTSAPTPAGSGASRNVVGGAGPAPASQTRATTGRGNGPARSGVIGVTNQDGHGRQPGRPAVQGSGGVVGGTPTRTTRTSGGRGFTTGGTGLVRRAGGRRELPDRSTQEERDDSVGHVDADPDEPSSNTVSTRQQRSTEPGKD